MRGEYQRLYGPGWEAKLSLPAKTSVQQAKAQHQDWSAEVETRIAAIRAAAKGEGQPLTQRQAHALAGEWYKWFVARHEENPGTPEHWQELSEVLVDLLEDYASDWVKGDIRTQLADEAKTAQFLVSKGVVLNHEAMALFLQLRAARLHGGTQAVEASGKWRLPAGRAAHNISSHSPQRPSTTNRAA